MEHILSVILMRNGRSIGLESTKLLFLAKQAIFLLQTLDGGKISKLFIQKIELWNKYFFVYHVFSKHSSAADSSYDAFYASVFLNIKNVPSKKYEYDCNSTLIRKDSLYKVECALRLNPYGEKTL